MTLGQLIAALKPLDPNARICVTKLEFNLTKPHSYRGYYEQLAFGYTADRYDPRVLPTVGDMLASCQAAIGTIFEGYKGGQYTMTENTELWVSNYGEVSYCRVVGVKETEWCVRLKIQSELE